MEDEEGGTECKEDREEEQNALKIQQEKNPLSSSFQKFYPFLSWQKLWNWRHTAYGTSAPFALLEAGDARSLPV